MCNPTGTCRKQLKFEAVGKHFCHDGREVIKKEITLGCDEWASWRIGEATLRRPSRRSKEVWWERHVRHRGWGREDLSDWTAVSMAAVAAIISSMIFVFQSAAASTAAATLLCPSTVPSRQISYSPFSICDLDLATSFRRSREQGA